MKICIVDNKSSSFIHFRRPLIRLLLNLGNEITVIVSDDVYKKEIESLCVRCEVFKMVNRSINPFQNLLYAKKLRNFFRQNNFDLVLTYQLKPNIFGCWAAKKTKVPKIIATIEGLGDPFLREGLVWKMIRKTIIFLYRRALKNITSIVCLNQDSIQILKSHGIGKKTPFLLFDGVGVDDKLFSFSPLKNTEVFLLVCRLLKTKGVMEYCQAAQLAKNEKPYLRFWLIGPEGDISRSEIEPFINDGSIEYFGERRDVQSFYSECGCFVLPSYGEGLSMATMEAMAVGRPVITTNTIGCRETVVEGKNGFLVPAKDPKSLANAILKMSGSPEIMKEFGKESRFLVEKRFSSDITSKKFADYLMSL